jgi:hypothetical protein
MDGRRARGLKSFASPGGTQRRRAGIVIDGRLIPATMASAARRVHGDPSSGPASGWKSLQQTVSETALGVDVETNGFDIRRARAAARSWVRRSLPSRPARSRGDRARRRNPQSRRADLAARADVSADGAGGRVTVPLPGQLGPSPRARARIVALRTLPVSASAR